MSKRRTRKGGALDDIFKELQTALDPASIPAPAIIDRVEGVLRKLQDAPDDEKEKLKGKDALLTQALTGIQLLIQDADHMPQGTARILLTIVGALALVEEILKELKKLHGIE
jgi:hypothetical protein